MHISPAANGIIKLIYLMLGLVFLVIGIIGVIFPIIPGFIFLIPALFCFAKASKIFNTWIKKNKYLKKYFT